MKSRRMTPTRCEPPGSSCGIGFGTTATSGSTTLSNTLARRFKFGLVRVFDANAAQPTFLFVRGDEAQPVNDKPLPPALPSLFNIPTDIQPVSLPISVYYPGLQSFVQDEERQKARQQLTRAEQDLAVARTKLANAEKQAEAAIKSDLAKVDPVALLVEARHAVSQAERLQTAEQANARLVEPVVAATSSVPPSTDATQRARENLIHVLFNHHEFMTVR